MKYYARRDEYWHTLNDQGVLLDYSVDTEKYGYSNKDVVGWCNENCQGYVTSFFSVWLFEKEDDMVQFALRWV